MHTDFLLKLLQEAGPSGYEARPARMWLDEAKVFARTSHDHYGNAYAEVGPQQGHPIVLMGHLDEIGLMVSHIDDKGHLAVLGIGGWDPQVLVGQRVRLLAREGDILAVVGKKAIHVMEADERKNASKLEDLWLDTGLSHEEVERRIPVGTVGVIEQSTLLLGDKLVSKAVDNRAGAFVVLEVLRQLTESGTQLHHRIIAIGTSQEEIGAFGAQVSSYHLEPQAGIVVDVTHETGQPGVSEKKYGKVPFGSGGNISVGSMINPRIADQLQQVAQQNGLPYSLSANPRYTATDGDTLALSRAGVPLGVVSIPNRYMHSPNEMVQLSDLQAIIDLLAAWIKQVDAQPDFSRM